MYSLSEFYIMLNDMTFDPGNRTLEIHGEKYREYKNIIDTQFSYINEMINNIKSKVELSNEDYIYQELKEMGIKDSEMVDFLIKEFGFVYLDFVLQPKKRFLHVKVGSACVINDVVYTRGIYTIDLCGVEEGCRIYGFLSTFSETDTYIVASDTRIYDIKNLEYKALISLSYAFEHLTKDRNCFYHVWKTDSTLSDIRHKHGVGYMGYVGTKLYVPEKADISFRYINGNNTYSELVEMSFDPGWHEFKFEDIYSASINEVLIEYRKPNNLYNFVHTYLKYGMFLPV